MSYAFQVCNGIAIAEWGSQQQTKRGAQFLVDRLYRFDADEGQQMNKKNKTYFSLIFFKFFVCIGMWEAGIG